MKSDSLYNAREIAAAMIVEKHILDAKSISQKCEAEEEAREFILYHKDCPETIEVIRLYNNLIGE